MTTPTPQGARPADGRPPAPSSVQASMVTFTVPPALVEAIAVRVVELLADRPTSPTEGGYLDVDQAADYLACKSHRVYDLVSQRRLRAFRDGRRLLFRRADLDAALAVEEAGP